MPQKQLSAYLYICTHERAYYASIGTNHPRTVTHHTNPNFGSFHAISLAIQNYPKTFSAINLAGKSSPAMR